MIGKLVVNGRELFYHQTGKGPSKVILVHGGPGLTLDYLKIIHGQLPSEEFTVFSYNQSGSFDSSPEFHTSIAAYANELKAVVEYVGARNCTVIGHSWGAAVVLEFLIQYPDMIAKAVIMDGFSSGKQLKQSIQNRIDKFPADFHSQRKLLLSNNDAEGYAGLLFQYWVPKHVFNLPDIPEDFMLSVARQAQPVFNHFMGPDILGISGEILDWDCSNNLNLVKAHVLLMSGVDDYLKKEETEEMLKKMEYAQLWFSETSSHMPMYEDAENFKIALIDFITSNGG